MLLPHLDYCSISLLIDPITLARRINSRFLFRTTEAFDATMPRNGGGTSSTTGAGTRRDVTLKVSQLQNLCKRDPEAYREDYDAQLRRLRSEVAILALSPSAAPGDDLVELIQFAAGVSSSSYKGKESDRVASLLIGLLLGQAEGGSRDGGGNGEATARNAASAGGDITMSVPPSALQLHRDIRKACVSSLILMRNKGAVPPLDLLELFFRIMASVPDRNLREMLHRHIVNDIRNVNKKGKRDEKVNRSIQTFLHRVVSSRTLVSNSTSPGSSSDGPDGGSAGDIAARRAVEIVAELYRRGVWTDERSIAILASAVESPSASVMGKAIRFFLGIEERMADDEQRRKEGEWVGSREVNLHLHSKKTSKKQRRVTKDLKTRKNAQLKRDSDELDYSLDRGVEASKKLYPAIELLNDPQGLAEMVFRRCRSSGSNSYKFEVKLLMINFVTRLVGNHELLLLPLYPYLQRYMGGQQRDVTSILSYTVQACHQYVPPDEVYGVLKTIAHNFITERCSGEQMAVGINACRALCARVPSVLSEDLDQEEGGVSAPGAVAMDIEAFARDLAAYSRHRDRSVSIAGKGWTNFIREVHPSLLQGKDRGTKGSALHRAGEKPLRYGEQRVAVGVEGADLLEEYEAQRAAAKKRKEERGDDGSGSDGDSDDGMEEENQNDVDSGDEYNEEKEEHEEAPGLVLVDEVGGKMLKQNLGSNVEEGDSAVPVTNLPKQKRDDLRQKSSSTRIFSAAEFAKMRKLVEREERAKRDPRAAARLKRRIAKGKQFEEFSDDDSDVDSDEDGIRTYGVVDPGEIMAESKRKRMNKAERLEKIIAGRAAFETKSREGGSTNTEKMRKKHFLMSKFSSETRRKNAGKETARKAKQKKGQFGHLAKKRRRKM